MTYKNPAATCVNPTPVPECDAGNKQQDGSACDCATAAPVQNPEWIYWCSQVKPCTFPEHNARQRDSAEHTFLPIESAAMHSCSV